MTTFMLAILLFSLVVVIISKHLTRKLAFKGRQPQTLEEIFNSEVKVHGIRYETFTEVYNALGDYYSLDPKRIRLQDPLKKFIDIDSWELGEGTKRINEWLSKNFGIENKQENIDTVLDLLMLIEKCRKED